MMVGGKGTLLKVPKTHDVRDSIDLMGVILAKMLNFGEMEL